MSKRTAKLEAISRMIVVVIIVIILVIAGAAAYLALATSTTTTTPPTTTTSPGTTSTSPPTTATTAQSTQTSATLTGTTSSSPPTTTTSSGPATTTASTTTSTTATGTSPVLNTLTLDDINWPIGSLNQLTSWEAIPFPNWFTDTVYQPLVNLNGYALQQTGAIQYTPGLAVNWTVDSTGTVYTFNLRQNVSFTDGHPFNAYNAWGDFYGLWYLTGNNTYWWLDYPIFNMSTSNFGPATLAMMKASGVVTPSSALLAVMENSTWPIYVTGPNQLVFHLEHSFTYFLGTLIVFQGLTFDTHYVLDNGGFSMSTPQAGVAPIINPYFNTNTIPGTGPYMVAPNGVSPNQAFVKFVKNPGYWGDSLTPAQIQANEYLDPGHVQNVVIQLKTDDTARYIDLSTGAAQVATVLDTNWPKILAAPNTYGYAKVPALSMLINGVALNVLRYPTNITAVRNAIYYAVNYSQINQVAYGGSLSPWVGPEYPVWKQFYNLGGSTPWPTNLTLAKQLLLSACAANKNACPANFPILDFRIQTGCTFCYNTATVIIANLAALNISADLEVTPISQYACVPNGVAGPCSFAQSASLNQTASQLTWLGAFTFAPGADTPADPWLGWVNGLTPANNWAVYSNPVVQKCDNEFTSGVSNATLLADCTAAQIQINKDTPYLWIGSLGLVDGSGGPAFNKNIIANGLLDAVYTGQSDTYIFNTITFTNGQ